jgi:phosphoserine phosphatase RsbU/P
MQETDSFSLDALSAALLDEIADHVRIIDAQGRVLYSNRETADENNYCTSIPGSVDTCESCIAVKSINDRRSYNNLSLISGRACLATSRPVVYNGTTYALEILKDVKPEKTQKSDDRMAKDLEVARSLQLSILRHNLPDIEGYRFFAEFLPCEALGGDMYDCFLARDGRVIMYVADVSGHGVMPAMLTVYLRQEMFAQCKKLNITPIEVLKNIQDSFEELNVEESIYITIFLLALDPSTGEFTCANAGHSVSPFIAGRGIRDLFLPGTPICRWIKSQEREEMKGVLKKGERLFLYTDGLDGIHSGTASAEDLKKMLLDGRLRGRELLSEIKKEYTKTKADDVTMLLCERE